MKLKIKSVIAAGIGLMALASAAQANTLYFQMDPNYTDGPRQAFIFGSAGASGTVSGAGGAFSQAFTLGANGFAVIDVLKAELISDTIENKGFNITSTSAVSGYFLSRATATTDMSYLIDGNKLGTNYVVAGYQNIAADQISAQALQDNTTVTFKLVNGETITRTLNAGQTYETARNVSLTGSFVTSNKPVAVFSGNACSDIPNGNTYCDHIMEQIPTVSSLSTQYMLARTPRTGTQGDVFRAVATEDGTQVKVNGVVVATLNAGQFYEGRVAANGAQVDTNKKVLLVQYLIGSTQANATTDPAMTVVPGSDQWLKSYVFATPSGTADFPTDYITVVIKTADIPTFAVGGGVGGPFTCVDMGNGYSFCNIDVSTTSGPFAISAANPFELLLSGYGSYDSYFTYGGAAFAPGGNPNPGVPEPGTLAIAGLGLAAVAAIRRRKAS